MKKAITTTAIILLLAACSHEKKLIRKASNAVERSDFDKAISYYDQVLQRDSSSYYANAGKGIVLSEYVGKHAEAIPYLEKALKKSPAETAPKIESDLGKSYHFIGNYMRALYYYSKVEAVNKPGYPDYDIFLTKRIADCRYAMGHPEVLPSEEASVKNIGSPVNTDMPEYGPVYTNSHLIFTSKRQDTPGEKKNGLDGRYFENIYISSANANGTFSQPEIYKVQRPALELRNYAKSAVSVSHDGRHLFVFKAGKLYETDTDDSLHRLTKVDKTINFAGVKDHACLTADGNTIFFTSTSSNGSGSDIYKAVKNEDGSWSDPQPLDFDVVNTSFDEESPYVNDKGVLFFSSNGLPGYGGFDVYETRFENGQWTKPKNLGQPVNSPGDDIYFVLGNNSSNGYYASARPGGLGDMDIYKVHYVLTEAQACDTVQPLLVMNASPNASDSMQYNASLDLPASYKNNARSYSWAVNGDSVGQSTDKLQYAFKSPGTYTLSARVVIYCDTCPALVTLCTEQAIVIGNAAGSPAASLANSSDAGTKSNSSENNAGQSAAAKHSNMALTDAQLNLLGWNASPAYFDFDESALRADAKAVLDQDIAVLKQHPDLSIVINGYADSRGTEAYNKNLSGERANAVKQYMLSNGIAKKRIKTVNAYGESQLVNRCSDGANCSEAEHQLNRRVKMDVWGNPVKTPVDVVLR